MMDLIERAPDGWVLIEVDGEPPSIRFYYGVRPEDVGRLPMGAWFGVVSSPNYYVHPQSPLRPWSYTVFEVIQYVYRLDRGAERGYMQVKGKRRQLTRFEVPHFEELWTDILLMGSERMMA